MAVEDALDEHCRNIPITLAGVGIETPLMVTVVVPVAEHPVAPPTAEMTVRFVRNVVDGSITVLFTPYPPTPITVHLPGTYHGTSVGKAKVGSKSSPDCGNEV